MVKPCAWTPKARSKPCCLKPLKPMKCISSKPSSPRAIARGRFAAWAKNSANYAIKISVMTRAFGFLLGAMFLQCALVYVYALTRIYTFNGDTHDIGSYLQVLDSITHSGIPESTLHPDHFNTFHWFGFHFTPLLYLVAAPYSLAPGIPMLMAIHTVLIASAAIPLYFAAHKLGLKAWGACTAAVVYLFNPITINAGI
ncbi:MAG: DUF2079 domain-containing protein [Alphaproteobacteria bacterium]|nr:DUF2079 domain-containing protein [Alphaproteobacteria bacterium]